MAGPIIFLVASAQRDLTGKELTSSRRRTSKYSGKLAEKKYELQVEAAKKLTAG